MPNPETCRERARECRRKAEGISDPRDRAHWLKLADDWIALSRIPFQSDSSINKAHDPRAGLWRGESVIHRALNSQQHILPYRRLS
jgi:hypothetical protein